LLVRSGSIAESLPQSHYGMSKLWVRAYVCASGSGEMLV
jgi:hypothetical protein